MRTFSVSEEIFSELLFGTPAEIRIKWSDAYDLREGDSVVVQLESSDSEYIIAQILSVDTDSVLSYLKIEMVSAVL